MRPIAADDPVGASVVVRREDRRLLVFGGFRQPGEPVYAAAARQLDQQAGLPDVEIWPVDLSGSWAVVAADVTADDTVAHGGEDWLTAEEAASRIRPAEVSARIRSVAAIPRARIGFRPMSRDDFPDVVRWQAEPHVAKWWSHEAPDVAGAERHYGPALDGTDPTRMWVVEVDDRAVGMLQDYRIGDHPDYALLTAQPDAIGFDYLIGEPALTGRGLGSRILAGYLTRVVHPHYPAATTYFAAPDHRNVASLRALEKIGFRQGLWFDEPQPDGRVDTVVGCTLDVADVLGSPAR
jgi:aminoglycoside 6'-N-acetyltransferase